MNHDHNLGDMYDFLVIQDSVNGTVTVLSTTMDDNGY